MSRITAITRKIFAKCLMDTHTGCWIWQGPTSGDGRGGGYARMSLDGQTVCVHRVTYTHHHGYIPSKKQIDHTCRNRLCVNPRHLEMVTHKENQRRRDEALAKDRADRLQRSSDGRSQCSNPDRRTDTGCVITLTDGLPPSKASGDEV